MSNARGILFELTVSSWLDAASVRTVVKATSTTSPPPPPPPPTLKWKMKELKYLCVWKGHVKTSHFCEVLVVSYFAEVKLGRVNHGSSLLTSPKLKYRWHVIIWIREVFPKSGNFSWLLPLSFGTKRTMPEKTKCLYKSASPSIKWYAPVALTSWICLCSQY